MAVKLREELRRLAGIRGANGDVFEELAGLALGTIEAAEHRALAVVGAALLEEALRGAITKHLMPTRSDGDIQLFEDEHAPLQGLGARTRMAYSLGIIDAETRVDFNYIRGIRVAFAHSPARLSFGHETILKSLNQITALGYIDPESYKQLEGIAGQNFDAVRYAVAVSIYCGALKISEPYWHPQRSLARALTIASLGRPAPQGLEAPKDPDGGQTPQQPPPESSPG